MTGETSQHVSAHVNSLRPILDEVGWLYGDVGNSPAHHSVYKDYLPRNKHGQLIFVLDILIGMQSQILNSFDHLIIIVSLSFALWCMTGTGKFAVCLWPPHVLLILIYSKSRCILNIHDAMAKTCHLQKPRCWYPAILANCEHACTTTSWYIRACDSWNKRIHKQNRYFTLAIVEQEQQHGTPLVGLLVLFLVQME